MVWEERGHIGGEVEGGGVVVEGVGGWVEGLGMDEWDGVHGIQSLLG